ncbi:hypothetical protein [Paenibacillus apis]|uniref:Uncharacterized protein n=1 Tax=Paenibacillus apis TaxID=1792174 RepID=A0A920CQ24_9BACL|nr:hypothetical protein [Paenibacillus apis]GIO45028.1 hypothetical protein J41TS4_47860 [Paenibacillus apis]
MKRRLSVVLALFLVVVMSSLVTSSSGAADRKDSTARPAIRDGQELTVYIDQLNLTGDGSGEIVVDPVQWYTGEEAKAEFAKYEPDAGIDGPPDGYFIVNESELLLPLAVAEDAVVIMQVYDRTGDFADVGIQWNERISLSKLDTLLHHTDIVDVRDFPYHLTIEDGKVTKIVQQYIP